MSDSNIPNSVTEVLIPKQPETIDADKEVLTNSIEQEDTNNDLSGTDVLYVDETDESTIEEKTKEPDVVVDVRKKQHVSNDFDINNSDKMPEDSEEVIFPSDFEKETREVIKNVPNVSLIDSEQAKEWAEVVRDGIELNTYGEAFVKALEEDDADFKQNVQYNNLDLNAQAPRFKNLTNSEIKGERAVIRAISALGMGTVFQVPLWHSGIWVAFKPPGETEIVELNRILINDKINLGRHTYGLVFSNTTAYTIDRLVEFALSHLYDTSVKADEINISNIKKHISCQDIPILLWGFICTMYPRGFRYKRACIADPEKCNFIIKDTINVTKLQRTNLAPLTEWQKTFMSSRQSKSKDLKDVNRYKEELGKIQKTKITIERTYGSNISFVIKTPNVEQYIDSGYKWIDGIVETVDKALTANPSNNERNSVITQYGQASAMRQYSHWVESIEIDSNIINDVETIENMLGSLSADDHIRVEFIKAVVNYIDSSVISLIGIPVFDCPSCKKTQEDKTQQDPFKNVLPIDVIQLFFVLLTQRINKLTQR